MDIAENLPRDIVDQVDQLKVDRRGDTPASRMVTHAITGYVAPGRGYVLSPDGLVPMENGQPDPGLPAVRRSETPPPHVRLSGDWQGATGGAATKANILGGVGTLTLDIDALTIPVAPTTPETVGYYGASLIAVGDALCFDTNANLPVTRMEIGPEYVDGFLHVEELGGGSYLEFHDRPHFHMPQDDQATGYLLLGCRDGEDYLVSAFSIPFGQAIYTAPEVLHDDAYLVGRYLVIYSVTENFSNVVFRSSTGSPVNPEIVMAG